MRPGNQHNPGNRYNIAALAVAACFGAAVTIPAYANPANPIVVNGAVQFTTAGNLLNIVNTPNAIINWGSFSINANEITKFVQQSASSAVLNRVVGQNPSSILGALQSNGRVFLINPNGIVFGAGSQINVGGLVASTLGMSNEDFLAGRMRFTGGLGNSVVNQGNITTQGNGGNVYLIGNAVTNNSIITSPKGEVILAAGTSVELVNPGTPDLRVEVVAPSNQALNLGSIVANSGRIGIYAGLINQAGTINANSVMVGENGQITLKATKNIDLAVSSVTTANGPEGGAINVEAGALLSAAGSLEAKGNGGAGGTIALKADVISQTGEVRADGASGGSVSMQARNLLSAARISADGTGAGGTIDLQASNNVIQTSASRVSADGAAGDGGSVTIQAGGQVFSSTVASATGAGTSGKGGTVKVLGNEIVLRGATLNASGDAGGGVVLVGGDLHGQNAAVANAKNASVNFTSTLKADANIAGDGGKVVVWSEGKTVFNGQASARGGAQSGNGGFIELSGKEKVNFGGFATAGAPKGKAGMLQLDPMNIVIDSAGSVVGYGTIDLADPNPGANEGFGGYSALLPNGNIVATDSNDSFAAPFAGAVYLFNGTTGALISSLTGSSSFDGVGRGVAVLTNGNYVVSSDLWNNGAATLAGAATFGSAATGVSGVVSAANSLVGTSANDFVGGNITALGNGNYLVRSTNWSNGAAAQAGAVTFGSGTTGVSGAVSAANSLVGTTAGDFVGSSGITVLSNGNYLVRSINWSNGAATTAGAVTFGSGTTGVSGAVSAANSLVGTTANDQVGGNGIVELFNGNYVVISQDWINGAATLAGAVTFGSGTTGISGAVSVSNSLVGTSTNDRVGNFGITALANGNYVVNSRDWANGPASLAGAVTWGSGTTGVSGVVSAANSLVGSTMGDQVGGKGVHALPNSNYVVVSPDWADGAVVSVGAVTLGSGTTGIAGALSAANSLVGTSSGDQVGSSGITVLTNGNYVVKSPFWANGAASLAGAVTWVSGTTGIVGAVSAGNSLVGSTASDFVGGDGFVFTGIAGVVALTNGNYVVRSPLWNNGAATIAGAVTWGSGTTGVSGVVSAANSLVGTTAGDSVGELGILALTNGNYVVRSPSWNNGAATLAGAATFGLGTAGVSGAVSAANSLVGTSANDAVGSSVTALANGNYVVLSPNWSNGAATSARAATFGSGITGVSGAVSAANSLVGTTANDSVGQFVNELANGNYVVRSPNWNNGAATQAGAVTFASGITGISGAVSAANSLVGTTAGDFVGDGLTLLPNGNYVVSSPNWDNGAVTQAGAATFGSGTTGISGVVSAANSLVGTTANDLVGDGGITVLPNGNYVVSSLQWNNGAATKAGAVTWGSSSIGVSGAVSAANSLVGATANDFVGVTFPDGAFSNITPLANGNFLVGSERFTNGGLQNAGRLQIYVPGGLNNPLAFSDSAASTVTITPGQITQITNTGTSVVLQANNDITLNAGSDIITVPLAVNGGDITLQAGRSVLLNSSIKSANGNVTIVANETAANGVFDAHRDPGAAEIKMASGTSIDAGSGNINLTLSTGAGLTNNQSGAIEIASLTTTGNVSVINTGSVVGGGPVDMVATPAAITSPNITLHGSSVGTAGHVHLDPGAVGNVFVTANTGGIFVEQIANTLNTGQYNFSASVGQEIRLGSSGGNININNNIALFGENLVFQTFGAYDIVFTGSRTVLGSGGSLSFEPDAARYVLLAAGATATFDLPTNLVTGTMAFGGAGSTLTGTGNITTNAGTTFNWDGGNTVAGTGVLTTNGATNLTGANLSRQWDNAGTATWTPGASDGFGLTATGTLNNLAGGKFILNSALASIGGLRGIFGAGIINNAGEFNKELNTAAVTTDVSVNFVTQPGGAVHVNSGALQFSGPGSSTDAGAYVVAAGATLGFTGGNRTLGATSTVSGAGDVNFSSTQQTTFAAGSTYAPTGVTTVSGGTVTFNQGGINVPNLTITGGALAGVASVAVSGPLIWSGGAMDTTGTLITAGSSTISAGDTLNGAWFNNGLVNITGGALTINTLTNAVIFVISGGTHALNGPTSGTGNFFINGGTTTVGGAYSQTNTNVNGGTVTFITAPTLNNYVQSGGTANFNAGGSATSATLSSVSSASVLNLNSGTLSASSYTQIGGAITGTGALTTAGMIWSGGTIDTTGTLTTSGASTIGATDTLNGAWINNGAASLTGGALTVNALTNTGTFDVTGGTHTLNGPTSGTGSVNINGGVTTVGGAYSQTNTTVTAGSVTFTGTPTLNNYTQSGGTANLNAGGNATSVNLSGASTLNLSGGALNAASYSQSNGAVTGTGALNVSGSLNWTGGTIDTTGTLTTAGVSTISATDTLNGLWINNGAANLTGGALTVNNFTNTGTFDITGGAQSLNGPTSGTGSITINGGATTVGGSYSQTATNVTAGAVTFTGAPTLNNYTQTGGTADLNAGGNAASVNLSGSGTLNLNGGTLITTNYTQSGGVLDGAGTFSASTVYNVTGGTQAGTGATVLAPGFTYVPGTTTLGRSLIVQGTLNEIAGDTLTIAAGRTLTINGVLNNAGTITGAGDVVTAASSVFNLTGGTLSGAGATTANGVVNITGGANLSRGLVSNNAFNLGSGMLNVSGSTLQLNNGGTASGLMNISNPGTLLFSGGSYNFSSGGFSGTGTTTVAGATVNLPSLNLSGTGNVTAGQLNVAGATSIAPTGVMTVSGGVLNANGPLFVDGTLQSTPPGIINTAGQPITVGGLLDLGGGTLQTTQLNIVSSGLLKGKGTVIGNVIVAGTFAPGTSPGIVNINGNYTQTGTLQIELGGITPGTGYDQVVVSGTANLGGTLDVRQFGAFVSPPGATFQVVKAGTVNGTFTNTIVPLIFSGLSTSYQSQFVELGNAAVTTASVLAPVDPSIVKQDRELVAVLKKLVGNDAVENALNAGGDGEKKNTPKCN